MSRASAAQGETAEALLGDAGITASGTGESVWVSADGVWHFMAGIETPSGMVTGQQLTDATAGTSAVATLDAPYDDPEKEALRQKLNELILAQRR
ncbi:MAG: hypothetical protein NT105_17710 [Verrucomicrobia bacterium]|nr:hypothetical protein [Verrucomicrobiota bacterium]